MKKLSISILIALGLLLNLGCSNSDIINTNNEQVKQIEETKKTEINNQEKEKQSIISDNNKKEQENNIKIEIPKVLRDAYLITDSQGYEYTWVGCQYGCKESTIVDSSSPAVPCPYCHPEEFLFLFPNGFEGFTVKKEKDDGIYTDEYGYEYTYTYCENCGSALRVYPLETENCENCALKEIEEKREKEIEEEVNKIQENYTDYYDQYGNGYNWVICPNCGDNILSDAISVMPCHNCDPDSFNSLFPNGY